jgi:hypothetical protein
LSLPRIPGKWRYRRRGRNYEISGVATPIRTSGDIIHEGHEFKLKIIVHNGTTNDITLKQIEFKENVSFSPADDEWVRSWKEIIEAGEATEIRISYSFMGVLPKEIRGNHNL